MTDAHGAGVSGPVVTLTTDFGLTEPFVGLVKARILAACPQACSRKIFRRVMKAGYGAASDWKRMLPALLPLKLHELLVRGPMAPNNDIGKIGEHNQ